MPTIQASQAIKAILDSASMSRLEGFVAGNQLIKIFSGKITLPGTFWMCTQTFYLLNKAKSLSIFQKFPRLHTALGMSVIVTLCVNVATAHSSKNLQNRQATGNDHYFFKAISVLSILDSCMDSKNVHKIIFLVLSSGLTLATRQGKLPNNSKQIFGISWLNTAITTTTAFGNLLKTYRLNA